MTYPSAIKRPILNRGEPPDSFLSELIAWGRNAPDSLFAKNDAPNDIYANVKDVLGPFPDEGNYRRAVMLDVMMVLGGFESSWAWLCGVDTNNPTSDTPETEEAGLWQVSANSRAFGDDLKRLAPADGVQFQHAMKSNHPLAMLYISTLLRHTVDHNGPAKRHEINPWLKRDAVAAVEQLLS